MENLKKALIGIIAGIICGLFASGGGLILVPAFIYLLKMEDKKARGTAVLCILPMVITSSIFYYKDKFINWQIGIMCAIGGIVGGIIGAKLLKKLKTKYVRILFTCFLLYVSIKILIGS
ncbi:MAG: sulfite exporter TauE/SafE family protein [Clostridia bacterium]|nr:sulfite exporter TauE/SafE family protein [Clostridia bacterium]